MQQQKMLLGDRREITFSVFYDDNPVIRRTCNRDAQKILRLTRNWYA